MQIGILIGGLILLVLVVVLVIRDALRDWKRKGQARRCQACGQWMPPGTRTGA